MSFEPIVTGYTTLTEEEQVRIGLHIHRNRLRRTMCFALLGLVLVVAGFAVPHQILLLVGLVLVFIWPAEHLYIKEYIKRYLKNPANDQLRSPTRVTISEDKIEFESQSGMTSTVPWTSIRKAELFEGNYLLYVAQNSPAVIVSRGQSPQDWDRFGQLVKSQVAK